MISNQTRNEIIRIARMWADLKVPYKHRGCTKSGADCSGLLVGILQELGYLKDFIMPIYPADWNLHNAKFNYLLEYINILCTEIPIKEKQPGDILLFKFGKQVSHAGIYIGNNIFIHCYLSKYTCYAALINSPWGKRLDSAWQLNESKLHV